MTYLLSIDPGQSTGIALGYYDAITPYRLERRWNVLGGVEGFIDWWGEDQGREIAHEMVVEQFHLDPTNQFSADLTPVAIEGALAVLNMGSGVEITWQGREMKSALIGYPPEARTKTERQRVRFDFLDRFGLFAKGAHNDDSQDAITHALVFLKRRKHMPTMLAFWPPPPRPPQI